LIFPYVFVGLVGLWFSQRFDQRGLVALGVHKRALTGAAPWLLAGLLASISTIVHFFTLAPGWADATLEALLWLTPATMIQSGVEEILFRGALLSMLVARYGTARGVLVSAALFALWHLYVGQGIVDAGIFALTTFVFGVSSAILVLHQGHLGGAIALHVLWNLVVAVDAGLTNWTGGTGVLGMFDSFWQSYLAVISQPWTLDDVFDPETVRFTYLPLVLETLIVFAVCRSTVDKIFGPRELVVESAE
jgi:membrane protease YdiL (CAAX protease family)